MKFWIFQGNPDNYDIDAYLQKGMIYWSVAQSKHQKEISIGDGVFLWKAAGRKRAESGIVAKATVIEECKSKDNVNHPERLNEEYWVKPEKTDVKAGLRVDDLRLQPDNGMVTARFFKGDSILSKSTIIKRPIGTNFPLSAVEAARVNAYWGIDGGIVDEYEGKEGGILYRTHRIRERDPSIRKEFLEYCRKKGKHLQCELCDFRPKEKYGHLGENLLEVHHVIPLSKYEAGEKTKVEDLMLVCPNCHRAIHKGDAEENLKTLRRMTK